MRVKTKQQLIEYASLYENADFLKGDPGWFMHQVRGTGNQEIMALIASCISYGSRKQFLPKIQTILDVSGGNLEAWIGNRWFEQHIPDDSVCFYRLATNHHTRQLLEGIRQLIIKHGSIGAYVQQTATTGITALEVLTAYFQHFDTGHLIPKNTLSSCKRLCMFLRWMVRDGSAVDLGLWTFIDKRTLLIPLDTHVMKEARRLGLIRTKSANMRTAIKLTQELRKAFPDDPLRGDFALFGYAVIQE